MTKAQLTVTLSSGKEVHLGPYGWHQSTEQYLAHGPLFEEEAQEAWKLWDLHVKESKP